MQNSQANKILCVGIVCLDVISVCEAYPAEGVHHKARRMIWQKGGNAANTSSVLGICNNNVDLFCVLPNNKSDASQTLAIEFIWKELEKYGVSMDHVMQHSEMLLSYSNILINNETGSRTILHSPGEGELSFEEFAALDLSFYSWIHFEGRNVEEVEKMMKHITAYNRNVQEENQETITISVELEKMRKPNLDLLLPYADLVVINQEYAEKLAYENALAAVEAFKLQVKTGAYVVCGWGEAGAACGIAETSNDTIMISAFTPDKVVDTLGAGDTFLAGLIHALKRGKDLPSAVNFACLIAGHKVGSHGYDCLRTISLDVE